MSVAATVIGALITVGLGGILGYALGIERTRDERLEAERAKVIAELSRLLYVVQDSFYHWANTDLPPDTDPQEHQVERGRAAAKSSNDLILYYFANELWLGPQSRETLTGFIESVQDMMQSFTPPSGHLGDIGFQLSADGRAVSHRIRTRIPRMREQIAEEFYGILYPTPWWQKVFPYRIRFNPPQG